MQKNLPAADGGASNPKGINPPAGLLLPFLTGAAAGFFLRQLFSFRTSDYVYGSPKLPKAFDGFRILHLSDFHGNRPLFFNPRFLETLRSLCPDLIVITGDIAGDETGGELAVRLVRALFAPCGVFYVPGNHEAALPKRDRLFRRLKYAGATPLFDRTAEIRRGGQSIFLSGLMDPRFGRFRTKKVPDAMRLMIRLRAMEPVDGSRFNLLITHRPEHLSLYAEHRFDLVFTGHAHGGQWRIPPAGGLYAPGQGLFPRYTGGFYRLGDTAMVVSRGLGNSILPLRINNPFDPVLVTLRTEDRRDLPG